MKQDYRVQLPIDDDWNLPNIIFLFGLYPFEITQIRNEINEQRCNFELKVIMYKIVNQYWNST